MVAIVLFICIVPACQPYPLLPGTVLIASAISELRDFRNLLKTSVFSFTYWATLATQPLRPASKPLPRPIG